MFYLVVVTLTFKILSGYIFESIRCIWLIHGTDGDVGKQHHSVTFNLGSAKVCLPAIYGTYIRPSQAGGYNLHHVCAYVCACMYHAVFSETTTVTHFG